MSKELNLLEREFEGTNEVECILSGIGKVNAAIAAQKLIDRSSPDCLLSIGVAGTFVEGLMEGETVIASRCAYHDMMCLPKYLPGQVPGLPLYFESDPRLVDAARKAVPKARVGLLCTGDQFYVSQQEDARQKALFPHSLAIDMEGAAVAQAALKAGIPFLAVKIISDNHTDCRQKERYAEFWDRMAGQSFTSVRRIISNIVSL